jgi:hypothetical protein
VIQNKPTIFISHIHTDEATANAIDAELRRALLGAVNVFNSSNRRSLEPGDPFRDKIIETLKNSECTLVIASPDSVSSPWVNFEAGGAWVSGCRVIPCCVKGMKPTSLPVPLSHLHGLSLDSEDGLTALLKHIAQLAGLDYPTAYDVNTGVTNIIDSWKTTATPKENDQFVAWIRRAERRPKRHVGLSSSGFFRARGITATDPIEIKQLPDHGLSSGDSVRCTLYIEGDDRVRSYCFAADNVADLLDELPENTLLRGTLECAGQIKIYSMPSWDPDDDRGIDYFIAWIIKDAAKA